MRKRTVTNNTVNSSKTLTIKTVHDFSDMVGKSPYSNKSEAERRRDLEKSVEEAKAALNTFSYQHKSFWLRIRMFLNNEVF